MKIIDLEDKFARSLVAGFFASVIELSLNLFSFYIIHFSHRRFVNWSAILIFGRIAENITEAIISTITQVGFATTLIIIFSYLNLGERSKNYIWKGLFLGLSSWFGIISFSHLTDIDKILPVDANSAISFMITSSIWGILGTGILRIIDMRFSTKK